MATAFTQEELEQLAQIPTQTQAAPEQETVVPDEVSRAISMAAGASVGLPQGDDLTEEFTGELQEFSIDSALQGADYIASHVNKGLLGNFLDLPFVVGNLAIDTINGFTGSDLDRAMLPTDMPGLRSLMNPAAHGASQDLKKRLRPYAVGLEFAAGAALPVAALGARASGVSTVQAGTPSLATAGLGKAPATLPISQALAPLPLGSRVTPATLSQSMTSPVALKAEAGLSAACGAGAGIASSLSGGNEFAELVGGVLSPVSLSAASYAVNKAIAISRYGKEYVQPSLEEGGAPNQMFIDSSMDMIFRHAEDPAAATANVLSGMKSGKAGTMGQLSRDKGIISFEKMVAKKGDSVQRFDPINQAAANQVIERLDSIAAKGAELEATKYLEARLSGAEAYLSGLVRDAQRAAKSAQERVGTRLETDSAGTELHKGITEAMESANSYLSTLWDDVPDAAMSGQDVIKILDDIERSAFQTKTEKDIGKKPFREHVSRLRDLAVEKGADDAPALVDKAGRPLADPKPKYRDVPVKELIATRSVILRQYRNLERQSDAFPSQKHFANKLQGGIVEGIERTASGKAYRHAASETRRVHDVLDNVTFKLDESSKSAIGSKLFRSGDVGADKADELLRVSGFNEGLPGAMDNFVRAHFANAAVRDAVGEAGEPTRIVDAAKGQTWLNNHAAFLRKQKNQALREELEEAVRTQVVSDRFNFRAETSKSKRDKTVAGEFIRFEDPQFAVRSVFSPSQKTPGAAAKGLRSMVDGDESGEALLGLQRMTIGALTDGIQKASSDAVTFKASYAKELNRYKPALKEIFKDSPDSLKLIDDVMADVAALISRRGTAMATTQISSDIVTLTAGKILGARAGAQIGVTPLISAHLGGKMMDELIRKMPEKRAFELAEDMLLNPAKYESSIKNIKKIEEADQATRMFRGWLINAGIHQTLDDD